MGSDCISSRSLLIFLLCVSTSLEIIVQNNCSVVAYIACSITHTIEKTHNNRFLSQKTFFRFFYIKKNHRLCTNELTSQK